ncbi:MAG TPA: SRPBCC family protein [Geminicoccus sp.]|jgi:uncharacterized protein YndB with AHSA1/START domain|uniref:SRPBCC family protein n=1 Tax=Geminicoccus sp. TaxID=2024832 RepID=UPI002E35C8DF|nr:SRPBCC family protein [Geminicoccus sp.]HEX2526281.1 SRPBCC family protein [Geminicoccus sp.]
MSDHGIVVDSGTVRFERLLPGPIERIWDYLTQSEKRATWLAGGPMELRKDGKVELTWHNSDLSGCQEEPPEKFAAHEGITTYGHVTRCEPPYALSYTWEEGSGRDSEVTFELSPKDELVQLVLTHRRLGSQATKVGVAGGWHTHLGILADRLEGRPPRPFWATYAQAEADYEHRLAAA